MQTYALDTYYHFTLLMVEQKSYYGKSLKQKKEIEQNGNVLYLTINLKN